MSLFFLWLHIKTGNRLVIKFSFCEMKKLWVSLHSLFLPRASQTQLFITGSSLPERLHPSSLTLHLHGRQTCMFQVIFWESIPDPSQVVVITSSSVRRECAVVLFYCTFQYNSFLHVFDSVPINPSNILYVHWISIGLHKCFPVSWCW